MRGFVIVPVHLFGPKECPECGAEITEKEKPLSGVNGEPLNELPYYLMCRACGHGFREGTI